ncbi:MAG TPA: hypothetical protein VGJ59_18455 [Jatrophihabitantaceae bacterium]|jgi:uncharacterized membrane protein
MSTTHDTERPRGRWLVFGTCVAAGLAYLGIGVARGQTGLAIGGPLVMLGYGVLPLLFARRNEIVGLLAGNGSDERRAQIQLRASAATAHVLILALVGGALWTLATGSRYTGVFTGLCAVSGLCYLAATAWFARRG